jgi:pimeloyl-ACP methyl ester carboxylesterase
VQDLYTVLEAEKIDRVCLVGHSSGGATAIVFASRCSDRVTRMAGLFNALVLDWVSPECNTLMQTAVG